MKKPEESKTDIIILAEISRPSLKGEGFPLQPKWKKVHKLGIIFETEYQIYRTDHPAIPCRARIHSITLKLQGFVTNDNC